MESDNRQVTRPGRNADGTFKKGVCGNPKGRPKKPTAIKKIAKESVAQLYQIAKDETTPARLKAEIWRWFFEIEFGKATQQMALEEGSAPIVSVQISDELKDYAG